MTALVKEYHIGGVDFEVRSAGGRVQDVSVLMGQVDADDPAKGETANALKLLLHLIDAAFVIDPAPFTDCDDIYSITPRYHNPMKFPERKRPSPVAEIRQFIIEGKHELTDKAFHTFMTELERNLASPEKVAVALRCIEVLQQKQRALQAVAEADQRDGKQEMKRLVRELGTIKPLLRPVVYTLAKHGIALGKDDDLQLAVILGLAEAAANATPALKASDTEMPKKFTETLMRQLDQIGLDVWDFRHLESDLIIEIGKAWKNRDRGQGFGAA